MYLRYVLRLLSRNRVLARAWAIPYVYSGEMRTYKKFEKLIRPIRACSRLAGHHTAKTYGKMVLVPFYHRVFSLP
eukprot:SAG11_NODE_1185_length_5591_cov_2.879097_5_plen_75_part_00